MYEVQGLYYLCSENKDADQLRGYREADLRLCFRICKKPVFSRCGSYGTMLVLYLIKVGKQAEDIRASHRTVSSFSLVSTIKRFMATRCMAISFYFL